MAIKSPGSGSSALPARARSTAATKRAARGTCRTAPLPSGLPVQRNRAVADPEAVRGPPEARLHAQGWLHRRRSPRASTDASTTSRMWNALCADAQAACEHRPSRLISAFTDAIGARGARSSWHDLHGVVERPREGFRLSCMTRQGLPTRTVRATPAPAEQVRREARRRAPEASTRCAQ